MYEKEKAELKKKLADAMLMEPKDREQLTYDIATAMVTIDGDRFHGDTRSEQDKVNEAIAKIIMGVDKGGN